MLERSKILVRKIYAATNTSLFRKDIRLSSQIQSAATSVMSNIAEGFMRHPDKEFIHFLFIAISSAAEVQSELYTALDQKYLDQFAFDDAYG